MMTGRLLPKKNLKGNAGRKEWSDHPKYHEEMAIDLNQLLLIK